MEPKIGHVKFTKKEIRIPIKVSNPVTVLVKIFPKTLTLASKPRSMMNWDGKVGIRKRRKMILTMNKNRR